MRFREVERGLDGVDQEWGDGGGEDERPRAIHEVFDYYSGCRYERAGDSERFAARRDDGKRSTRDREMLGQSGTAHGAVHTGCVGVVHDEGRSILVGEVGVTVQGRDIPVHAEQRFRHQESAAAGVRLAKVPLDPLQVQVGHDRFLTPAQSQAVNDAGVVACVADGAIVGSDQCRDKADIGLVSAREKQSRFCTLVPGQALLERCVRTGVSAQ